MLRIYLFGFLLCCCSILAQDNNHTYLALGDSYTVATGETLKDSWANQLVDYLYKKNVNFERPVVIAGAGWTTTKLLEEIEKTELQNSFDYVSLMIGVNNQYRGLDFNVFKNELEMLIKKCISLADDNPTRVIIISIPDWSVTPFAKFKNQNQIRKDLKIYNSFIKKKAHDYQLHFVDVTKSSQNMAVNKALIAPDSLHPSKKMHRIWAKIVSKKVLKNL